MIEILTVIAIISVLVGIVLGVAKFARHKAHIGKTRSKLSALAAGLENCKRDRGYYPSTDGDETVQLGEHDDFSSLTKLSDMPSGWDLQKGNFRDTQTGGAYLEGYEGGKYADAWGHPFLYRCDGNQHAKEAFDLFSAGGDGKIGTDDDVTSWQRN